MVERSFLELVGLPGNSAAPPTIFRIRAEERELYGLLCELRSDRPKVAGTVVGRMAALAFLQLTLGVASLKQSGCGY
jgi:hypothetical protein